MSKIFASVDIGSNAVRLLFANVHEIGQSIRAEKATLVRIPVRLGLDVFETGRISKYRHDMLINTLKAYKMLIDVYNPEGYRACATAAMREAKNSPEILKEIKSKTGFNVEIIDGREEARIISKCENFDIYKRIKTTVYIDVGGGSTEISVFHKEGFLGSNSFNIGTIRLLTGAVKKKEWIEMKKWVMIFMKGHKKFHCIGSGGNINKLTKLFGNDLQRNITFNNLNNAHKKLRKMSIEDRMKKYSMRPDRADVIVPAASIFLKIMKWIDCNKVITPKFGLADGLAILQYQEKFGSK